MPRKLVTKPMSASLLKSIEELFTPFEQDLKPQQRVAKKVRKNLKTILKNPKRAKLKVKKR
jgi:hypothetical protein